MPITPDFDSDYGRRGMQSLDKDWDGAKNMRDSGLVSSWAALGAAFPMGSVWLFGIPAPASPTAGKEMLPPSDRRRGWARRGVAERGRPEPG